MLLCSEETFLLAFSKLNLMGKSSRIGRNMNSFISLSWSLVAMLIWCSLSLDLQKRSHSFEGLRHWCWWGWRGNSHFDCFLWSSVKIQRLNANQTVLCSLMMPWVQQGCKMAGLKFGYMLQMQLDLYNLGAW